MVAQYEASLSQDAPPPQMYQPEVTTSHQMAELLPAQEQRALGE